MGQKKHEMMYQEYGKYFLDLSKLVFGGVILAGIMNLGGGVSCYHWIYIL